MSFFQKILIKIVIYYDNYLLGICDRMLEFGFLIENLIIII